MKHYSSLIATILLSFSSILAQGQVTQVRDIHCDQIAPFYMEDNVLADVVAGVDQYQFFFYDGTQNFSKVSNNYSVLLYLVPGLSYGVDYDVFVRTRTNGIWSDFGDTCQIEMAPMIPVTQLRPLYCSADNPFFLDANILAEYIYAADSYEFAFHDGTTEYIYPSSNYSFFLYEGPELVSGVDYDVYVRSILEGDTSAWGDTCIVSVSSMVPIVNVRDQYCMEDTLYELDNTILADWTAGYDAYQWQLVNGTDTFVYQSDNYSIDLDEVIGVAMGQTYEVRVAAIIGSSIGEYGSVCYVSTASIVPSSQLLTEYCNSDSIFALTDSIVAEIVDPLVDEWVFVFNDGTSEFTLSSDTSAILLADVPGLMPGVTYEVTVEAGVQGNYSINGISCSLMIEGTPIAEPESSTLSAVFCNSTTPLYLDNIISAEQDTAATSYIFYFINQMDTIAHTSTGADVLLNDVPGLLYGEGYMVIVETAFGAIESVGGASCLIFMADAPEATDLVELYCDSVYHFPSAEILGCEPVFAAEEYEFRFSQDVGIPVLASSADQLIGLDEVPGLNEGFYDVDARAFAGGAWSEWGQLCPIELNDSTVSSLTELLLPELIVYPNPSDAGFTFRGLDGLGRDVHMSIFNSLGQSMMRMEQVRNGKQIYTGNLSEGLYLIRLEGENGLLYRRMVIKR